MVAKPDQKGISHLGLKRHSLVIELLGQGL
jgi:hypothetical protein